MRFDPFTDAALADPYPQYAAFRAADPVHWSEKLRAWVLFRHHDVAAALGDEARFSADRRRASRAAGGGLEPAPQPALRTVSSDPPDGHAAHALLNAALVPRVRAIGPRIDAIVDGLLAGIDGRREIDLVAEFAHALPIRVIAELLDIPEAERTRFQALSRTIARGMDRLYGSDDVSSGLREIGAYFLGLVTERAGRTRAIDRAIGRWLRVTGCATCGWRGGSASKSIERGNFTCDRMLGDAGQARTLVASATRLARGRTHVGEAAVADPKGPDTGKD